MTEILPILSAEQYFDKYGREGIYKNHADKKLVKHQLIDAFHKEIFGLVAMRAKKQFKDIPLDGDPEAMRIAKNVVKDTMKKWKKLVDLFEKYNETSGVIAYSDITIDPGEGEMGIMDGEIVKRDAVQNASEEIADENVDVLEEIPPEAVIEDHAEGDTDGDVEIVREPAVTGLMDISDEVKGTDA